MTSRRSLSVLALALVAIVVVAHARVIVGGETWADLTYHAHIAPPRLAAAAAVEGGALPAWWDGSGLGVPLAAEPSHGAMTPALWLAWSPRALDLVLVLHLAWAAIGVALWARRRGASQLGALVGGALAATAGVVASSALRGELPMLAHLPWIAWAASDRRSRVALGALIGAVALGGQLGALIDAVVLAVVIAPRRDVVLPISAGLAIGAAQWLPALYVGGAGAFVHGLPLARFGELVAASGPLYLGASLVALAALARPGRLIAVIACYGVLAIITGRGGWPHWFGGAELHVGALALVLAALAAHGADAVIAGQRRAPIALAIAAGVSAVALAVPHASLVPGALAVACTAGAAAIAWRVAPDRPWRAPLAFALVLAPYLATLRIAAPTLDAIDTPAFARAGEQVPAPRRLFRAGTLPGLSLGLDDQLATLAGTFPARWGIDAARDEDPARPRAFDATWLAAANGGGALLDRFGIALAILPAGQRGFEELARRDKWALVHFPAAAPASVYTTWEWTRDSRIALGKLFPSAAGANASRARVVLDGEGAPNEELAEPPAPCTIERWQPGAIDLTCRAGEDGYAVVSSSALRGWSVTVDDRDASWLVADVLRRAVALPAGVHRVSWRYRAPGLAAGLAVAAFGVLALVALALWTRRRSRHSPAQT